jgi:hypothetical protein
MIKGYEFEEWAVNHLPYLQGGQYQVKLSKQYGDYLLYGIVDVLKAGIVYDLKYTSRYDVGKYRGNTQTVMYLTLVPEAHKMIYVASNDEKGNGVIWQEEYSRDEIEPLDALLYNFRNWLEATKLWNVYIDLWRAR